MHRPMRRLTARLTCLLLAASLAGCGASSVNQLGSQSQFADGLDAVALSPGESAGEKTGRDAAAKDATKPRAAASASVAAKSENMTGGGHTSKVTVAKNSNVKEIAEQFTAKSKPGHAAYKIGALDVLEISVFKVDELSKTVQVADTGSISVPLLGEVEAAGRTAREVEQDLTKQWGAKYLNNPQVTVFIKEYNSKRITVEGSVKKPGVFPIQGHMSLLQSIAHAQGLEQTADGAPDRGVVPDPVWERYLAGELEDCRTSGVYFVPSDGEGSAWQPGDVVFAPLRFGQSSPVGAIRVQEPADGLRPSSEALYALDILASQAAYVLENARLLDEAARAADALAEQVDELSMMHRADRELGAHLDMDRIMTLTMDWALRRTRADTGLLALMADDRSGLVPFITMGYLDQAVSKFDQSNPWPLTLGAVGEAARTGETIVRRDFPLDDEQAHLMPGARAQIAVPLSMRGEILGVIMLASGDPETFEDADVSFLERLARRAAVALDNARLFRQSEQLADDMAVLYSASRTITSTLDRDEVLQHIAQSMAVALECSSALILDYHAETQDAQVLTVYRVGTARDAHEALPTPGHVFRLDQLPQVLESIASQRPLILRAADPGTPNAELTWLQQRRIQAAVMIPLVAQGELIGVALVIEGRRDRGFTSNEVFKAQTLASQASVALRQSLLFNEVLELEKVKSEMIRMASHDLRNPLNNILGYIELLDMTFDPARQSPEIQEYLGSLRRSAKTMQSLITDLLTLERVESERESEWQAFDLSGLVYEAAEAEQSGALLRNITLVLEREEDTAPVFGSMTQLRQAIANLIGNAVKYTPDGGRVEVRFTREEERLRFAVQDTGYGISPERQARLFERFYRAREPGTDHIPGTGLGLSLVKTVIERHGGQVWFESEVGVGSTFGFWLPAAQPSEVEGAALR